MLQKVCTHRVHRVQGAPLITNTVILFHREGQVMKYILEGFAGLNIFKVILWYTGKRTGNGLDISTEPQCPTCLHISSLHNDNDIYNVISPMTYIMPYHLTCSSKLYICTNTDFLK